MDVNSKSNKNDKNVIISCIELIFYNVTIVLQLNIFCRELDNNAFRFLHEYPSAKIPNLVTLHLGNNHIDYIPLTAFENATSLVHMRKQRRRSAVQ